MRLTKPIAGGLAGLFVGLSVGIAPTPTDARGYPVDHAPQWIAATIRQAGAEHGVSADLLLRLASCESAETFDPTIVSPVRFDGGRDEGLFQIHRHPDGSSLMDLTPYAGQSPFDVWSAANAAAWLISRGYGPHWLCWGLL